jgi:hypothetical protein
MIYFRVTISLGSFRYAMLFVGDLEFWWRYAEAHSIKEGLKNADFQKYQTLKGLMLRGFEIQIIGGLLNQLSG